MGVRIVQVACQTNTVAVTDAEGIAGEAQVLAIGTSARRNTHPSTAIPLHKLTSRAAEACEDISVIEVAGQVYGASIARDTQGIARFGDGLSIGVVQQIREVYGTSIARNTHDVRTGVVAESLGVCII